MKKAIVTLSAVIFLILMGGCIKSRDDNRVLLIKSCVDGLCSFQLVDARVQISTNVLGKDSVHVLSQQPLSSLDVTWTFSGGVQPTSNQLTAVGLPACQTNSCSDTDNPTGRDFSTTWGQENVAVTGTATLSNGQTVVVSESENIYIFPTQVTYAMPSGSTITATAAADAFAAAGTVVQGNVAQVIGTGGIDGTLTFICRDGFFIDPVALTLAEGGSQSLYDWTQIDAKAPTPIFDGTSWHQIGFIDAVNNLLIPVPDVGNKWATGLDCGTPK